MKEVIFEKTGLPSEVLELKESPMPQPKEGQVLIKVTARNINPSDIMFIRGMYGIAPVLPSSAGFEAAGVVEKGDAGGILKEGTRVMFSAIGTWKEYVCVPASLAIPIPEGMPDEVACQAFVNPMTAYGMLEKSGLKEGDWLLITAGASAFGKFALQMAKERGIKVAATVRHDDQIEYLEKMGADLVINSEKEKIQKVLPEKTDGGVHVVFDAVGGTLGAKALASLRPKGKMMVFNNLQIEAFWLSTWMDETDPKTRGQAFLKVFGFLMKDDSKIDIAGKFPLAAFKEALNSYEMPGRNGKILLVS